jgi:DNA-damage-inducible protein D
MTQLQKAQTLNPFDALRRTRPDTGEFWSARELAPLLGYDTWRNFSESIERARTACDNSGQDSRDHIVGASKMITVGKGAEREVLDYHLTRYAAYLVAMNGDARKDEVAQAQTYFAVQTRRAEVAQQLPALPADPLLAQLQVITQMRQDQLQLASRTQQLEQRLDASPITHEKINVIHKLGQQLGQHMGNYRTAWRLFNERFGIASYRDLPTNQYEAGQQFLRMQIAAYTGQTGLNY